MGVTHGLQSYDMSFEFSYKGSVEKGQLVTKQVSVQNKLL